MREKIKMNPIDDALVIDGEVVSKNFQEHETNHRKEVVQNQDATLFCLIFYHLKNLN